MFNQIKKLVCIMLLPAAFKVDENFRCRPDVFSKKGTLKSFTKFTEKHQCRSLFLNKVAGLSLTLLKKRLWHRCFPVNFAKFLRTPFLQNTSKPLHSKLIKTYRKLLFLPTLTKFNLLLPVYMKERF